VGGLCGLVAGIVLGVLPRPPRLLQGAGLPLVALCLPGSLGGAVALAHETGAGAGAAAVATLLLGWLVAGIAGIGLLREGTWGQTGLWVALALFGLAVAIALATEPAIALFSAGPLLLVVCSLGIARIEARTEYVGG